MNTPGQPETTPAFEPAAAEAAPASAAADVEVLSSRGIKKFRAAASIRSHDFRESGFLAPSELRRLKQRHDQFVRSVAARLAILFRLEYTVRLKKVEIVGYHKYVERLPASTHVILFKAEPLKGVGLLNITPRLGLSFVDRLLGGPGDLIESTRDLTEIEITLIDQVAALLLAEWCNQWPELHDLHSTILGQENNSRFLQTSPPDTAMLVICLEAGSSGNVEPIELVLPYLSVEPLVRLLSPPGSPVESATAATTARLRWNKSFDDLPVPITAEWDGLKLAAGDLTRLKQGDVLMLGSQCGSQVRIRFSNTPKFVARAGQSGGRWAVQLTSTFVS